MESSFSAACSLFALERILRIVQMPSSSSLDSSNSSRRVPDLLISTAGKIRFSESLRSRCSSLLPVPLNSSKIISSILEPVSTKAVAKIVRLPPFSIFLAEPKNFFGLYSAPGSIPPERVRPVGDMVRLYARASRVMLSNKMTTSFPCSTKRCARSRTSSEVRT